MVTVTGPVAARTVEAARDRHGVRIVADAPRGAVITKKGVRAVRCVRIEPAALQEALRDPERGGLRAGWLLVVNGEVAEPDALQMADMGVLFLDAGGQVNLGGGERAGAALTAPWVRWRQILVCQMVCDAPGAVNDTRMLADLGDTTMATVSKVLGRLEEEGLIARTGRTRDTHRAVLSTEALVRWMARTWPPRERPVDAFIPDEILAEITNGDRGSEVVLTGSAAARRRGMVLVTRPGPPTLRLLGGSLKLPVTLQSLGGFRSDRGANCRLIADPHGYGFTHPVQGPPGVASWCRTGLDLLCEPRGADALDLYLDQSRALGMMQT